MNRGGFNLSSGSFQTRERLCVVIPVYNEQSVVGTVLEKWHSELSKLGIDFEIRAYNDGSRDGSLDKLNEMVTQLGPRIVVRDKPNEGHGPTILRGYQEAVADGFDWIFQIDSDDEMGPESFARLWSMRCNLDFVVGRRNGRRQAWPRKIISWTSRLSVRVFYGRSIWDVNAPYRLMRVSAFKSLLDLLPSDTFAPNVILSGLAARNGLRCAELPVPQHDRTTGEVSIKKWKLLVAAQKSFGQTMRVGLTGLRGWCFFILLAMVSTILKFHASTKGWNYDFASYQVVADIVQSNGNVYMQTYRYNYGPIWFWVLGILRNLPGAGFRYGIIILLSFADIGLGTILWKKRMYIPVLIFLLSNISIHITGFHNQFDNLAVLVALVSLLLMDEKGRASTTSYWFGVFLLGISITLKHIFVFMPFWLLFRKGTWKRAILSCLLPLAVFGGALALYAGIPDYLGSPQFADSVERFLVHRQEAGLLASAKQLWVDIRTCDFAANGIIENVLKYRSQPNGLFCGCISRLKLSWLVPDMVFFFVAMMGLGWFVRKRQYWETGLIYTLGLFVFSPAIAMQYYAIPCVAAAVYWFPFGLLYHVVLGVLFLFRNGDITTTAIPILLGTCLLLGCLIRALRKGLPM